MLTFFMPIVLAFPPKISQNISNHVVALLVIKESIGMLTYVFVLWVVCSYQYISQATILRLFLWCFRTLFEIHLLFVWFSSASLFLLLSYLVYFSWAVGYLFIAVSFSSILSLSVKRWSFLVMAIYSSMPSLLCSAIRKIIRRATNNVLASDQNSNESCPAVGHNIGVALFFLSWLF